MSGPPDTAWVEAARQAAARTFEAVGPMKDLDLGLTIVSQDDATATNSSDSSFLDYLDRGGHLNINFLAGVK